MSRARLAWLLVATTFLTFCSRETANAPASSPGAPVIIISIDTLRSDRLPAYGYKGVETPQLDRFRADSILFLRAYSHSPMTLPSHVSMLTGLLPNEHGVRNNIGYRYDVDAHAPITRKLAAKGYATGAAVSSYVLRGESGLARAFDFYEDSIAPHPGASFGEYQRPGSETAALALRWIESKKEKPFFFLFHIYEPHVPYAPPEPYRSRYASAYDGEIAASDAIVGSFLDQLRALGIYDRALIIVTSDHGEGLGDHGEEQHSILLYREAIQVPLLVKLPNAARRGTSVEHPVGLADLVPTIAAVTGVEGPTSGGRSLLDPPIERSIYSETLYPRIHFGWSELKSMVSGNHHYIHSPRPELYDVVADPSEKQNLVSDQRRVAASLREQLAKMPAGTAALEPIRPEDAAKLGALGYLGRAAASPAVNGNPVDEIGLLERIREAYVLAEQKRFAEAEAALRRLLDERPALIDARLRLAELLVENGRDDLAIAEYDELLARATVPLPDALLASAALLLRQGKIDDAELRARAALSSNESRAREILARAALQRGQLDAAAGEAAKLPRSPEALVLQAEIAKMRGDQASVLRLLDDAQAEAMRKGREHVFRLDFVRGDALARLERTQDAIAAYEREIAAFPNDLDAYAGLAVLQFVMGDARGTERTLERMVAANRTDRARALAAKTRAALRE